MFSKTTVKFILPSLVWLFKGISNGSFCFKHSINCFPMWCLYLALFGFQQSFQYCLSWYLETKCLARQVHNGMGEQLANGLGSKGSKWGSMRLPTSHGGFLQDSILGPVLFNICINNLDTGVECTVSYSDLQLGGVVDSFKGREAWRETSADERAE